MRKEHLGREQNILLYRIKRYITKLKEVSNLKTNFVHVHFCIYKNQYGELNKKNHQRYI